MRKLILVLMLTLVALPVLAQDVTPEPGFVPTTFDWTCPPEFAGQSLNIYNWSTYVAPDTISNFEAACGVTVTYDIYGSGDELLSRLRQGNPGYDLVVPPDQSIQIMIAEGLIDPLDLSKIPNFANLKASLANPAYDPGNVYSIPYQWGTIGIGYDRNKVGADITSWNQVWDYAGPVAWLEDKRPVLGVALLMLGYDPNTTDEAQIEEAKQYLIEKGGNVVSIAADDGQEQLARGEVDIVIEFMGDIYSSNSWVISIRFRMPARLIRPVPRIFSMLCRKKEPTSGSITWSYLTVRSTRRWPMPSSTTFWTPAWVPASATSLSTPPPIRLQSMLD